MTASFRFFVLSHLPLSPCPFCCGLAMGAGICGGEHATDGELRWVVAICDTSSACVTRTCRSTRDVFEKWPRSNRQSRHGSAKPQQANLSGKAGKHRESTDARTITSLSVKASRTTLCMRSPMVRQMPNHSRSLSRSMPRLLAPARRQHRGEESDGPGRLPAVLELRLAAALCPVTRPGPRTTPGPRGPGDGPLLHLHRPPRRLALAAHTHAAAAAAHATPRARAPLPRTLGRGRRHLAVPPGERGQGARPRTQRLRRRAEVRERDGQVLAPQRRQRGRHQHVAQRGPQLDDGVARRRRRRTGRLGPAWGGGRGASGRHTRPSLPTSGCMVRSY